MIIKKLFTNRTLILLSLIAFLLCYVGFASTVEPEGIKYTVYVDGIEQPGWYVIKREVLYAAFGDQPYNIYKDGEVIATATGKNDDMYRYPTMDDDLYIIYLTNIVPYDPSLLTPPPTEESTEQEPVVEEPTDIKVDVDFEIKTTRECRGYVWESELLYAKQHNTDLTVYNYDGTVLQTYPVSEFEDYVPYCSFISKDSSIWDYVPKDTPTREEMYDYTVDYSTYKEGDIFGFQKRYDGTLRAYIVRNDVDGVGIYTLDDGNSVYFRTESSLNNAAKAIEKYNTFFSECDVSRPWRQKLDHSEYRQPSYSKSDYKELNKQVQTIIKDCKTDREKAHALAIWICQNVSYSTEHKRNTHPVKIFTERKCVCAGFAFLYQYMCIEAGLHCLYVESIQERNHAWNAIYLEGYWQCVDIVGMGGEKRNKYQNHFTSHGTFPMFSSDMRHNYKDVKPKASVNQTFTKNNVTYCITQNSGGTNTVTVKAAKANKKNTVTIPSTVQYEGKTYKVNKIDANFSNGSYKLKKVVIGKNVALINGQIANSNTTSITFKTTKIANWNNIKIKCKNKKSVKITVPKSVYKTYKKAIRAKKSKVKVKK